jgi:hypothetical protein
MFLPAAIPQSTTAYNSCPAARIPAPCLHLCATLDSQSGGLNKVAQFATQGVPPPGSESRLSKASQYPEQLCQRPTSIGSPSRAPYLIISPQDHNKIELSPALSTLTSIAHRRMQSLLGGADCSTSSNPLKQFAQREAVDNSLFRVSRVRTIFLAGIARTRLRGSTC